MHNMSSVDHALAVGSAAYILTGPERRCIGRLTAHNNVIILSVKADGGN
jgi:hypothetical protein